MPFRHHDRSRLALAILVAAALTVAGGSGSQAGEAFRLVKSVEGFPRRLQLKM